MNELRVMTGDSAANTEKTHTVAKPGGKKIYIYSLSVSTSGADISADAEILIKDNAVTVWKFMLRTAVSFGGFMTFSDCPIPIRDGNLTIVTGEGGAGVIVTVSITYKVI